MSYLLVSLAIATNTVPSQWHQEDPLDVVTAVHILNQQAEEARRG